MKKGKSHTDVSSENVLNLLLLETTLDNQTSATVHTAAGTQFGEQELHNVVVGTLHTLADVGDVGEDSTTVTFTQTLGRGDLVGLGAARQQIGVVALDEGEESRDQQRVGDSLRCVVGPDARSGLVIALGHFLFLLLAGLLGGTGLGQLGLEIAGILLGLLLLLLQGRGVELAVGGWAGLVAFSALGLLGLLGLLLFRQSLEHLGDFIDGLVGRSCVRRRGQNLALVGRSGSDEIGEGRSTWWW